MAAMTKNQMLAALREYCDEGLHSPSEVPETLNGILADMKIWVESYPEDGLAYEVVEPNEE